MKLVVLKNAKAPAEVGGKAASLGDLIRGGFNVPDGFVISTHSDMKMTPELEAAILQNFDKLEAKKVAVRSSAVAEDSKNDTWAGQFDTFLNINRANLIKSIEKCWQSAFSKRALAYAKEKGLKSGPVAVIVQAMVPAKASGVAFSLDPITQDQSQVVIEAVRGLADQLVSGKVSPDRYKLSKKGKIVESNLSGERPILANAQLKELLVQIVKIEKHYDFPVDIEWSFANGELYILQSRPITTLSNSAKQAKLYETQKSLTEWFEDIGHKDTESIREEDNDKRERLKVLKQAIGLPFDEPVQFKATDLRDKSPALSAYLKKHGSELCALRLIPTQPGVPKLRMRGLTVSEAYKWFLKQNIDADKYRADYMPHTEKSEWSTIFVVNKHGIQGEIIRGGHSQLTQGFFDLGRPIVFSFDFKNWKLIPDDQRALKHLRTIARLLYTSSSAKQKALKQELGSEFVKGYLMGYFETVETKQFGLWFVDYSRLLGNLYQDLKITAPKNNNKSLISGLGASGGKAKGQVRIIKSLAAEFGKGDILVCKVTTPDFVPLMQRAAAIITDQGGILSHAAIIARELKKPCIVGTKNATKILKNGQTVSVDADIGVVIEA